MRRFVPALVLLLAPAVTSLAQAPAAAAPKSGFRAEFLAQLDDVEKKLVSLAEAIPADKYGWRPAEGVRSVSEVFMHVGGGNYFIMGFAGVKAPSGMDPSAEKSVTDKAKVVSFLKDSFAHVRKGVESMSDADLDKPAKIFGHDTTTRGVLLLEANHMHEHLGQSIAYARMNGVVPPWTAPREQKPPAAQKKEGGD